jgi:hypothetical protein
MKNDLLSITVGERIDTVECHRYTRADIESDTKYSLGASLTLNLLSDAVLLVRQKTYTRTCYDDSFLSDQLGLASRAHLVLAFLV